MGGVCLIDWVAQSATVMSLELLALKRALLRGMTEGGRETRYELSHKQPKQWET